MITRAFFNNKSFKIIDGYTLKFSNNEVSFNDIKIDFTGHGFEDIPFKYQEIKILKANTEDEIMDGEVVFTGFLDTIKLSDIKNADEDKEMTLTLLSPLKMSTVRTVSLIGTYSLKNAIERIVEPLINDGFTIKEINVPDGQITVNFLIETVENCMNDIGNKRNLFWHINELKEIYINSIDYLFGLPISKIINGKESGFIQLQPTIENIDYANVINFKNVRLIYSQENTEAEPDTGYPITTINKVVENGDIVEFENPIVLSKEYLEKVREEGTTANSSIAYNIGITLELTNGDYKSYFIGFNSNNTYVMDKNITIGDSRGEEGEIVLQKDSFFSNLITGFKWNYNSKAKIVEIHSDTALRYTIMRFMFSAEINKLKGIISDSGQIEKAIDYNEKWTTLDNLINDARSLIMQNSNVVNQVTIKYDINPKLKIGDILKINMPEFLVVGNFAIKEINYVYNKENDEEWTIIAKTSDLNSTYIDLFRPQQKEENQEAINTIILSELVEEQIKETHSAEEVVDEN